MFCNEAQVVQLRLQQSVDGATEQCLEKPFLLKCKCLSASYILLYLLHYEVYLSAWWSVFKDYLKGMALGCANLFAQAFGALEMQRFAFLLFVSLTHKYILMHAYIHTHIYIKLADESYYYGGILVLRIVSAATPRLQGTFVKKYKLFYFIYVHMKTVLTPLFSFL